MRLLYINYEFPPVGGGGGNANAQIARQMAELGHEVVVITSAYKGLPRRETRDGYLIVRIPTLRKYQERCRVFEMVAFLFSSIFFAAKWVRRWRPDVCIAFFTLPSGPAAWALKKLYRIPYIVSLHGGDVPGSSEEQLWFYHWLTSSAIRYLWREAQAVVSVSEGLRRLAQRTSPELPIAVIPNGVDANFFDGLPPSILPSPVMNHVDGGAFRLLTVGRLSVEKGISTLLMAFKQIKSKTNQSVQLWIVGDGPLRKTLERLAYDLKIEEHVFFFGWQDKETLKAFYSSANLLVHPSLDEGMPIVLLEAMAMGLPIVATNVTGNNELVVNGENGYLVPSKNADAITEILLQLMKRPDLLSQMSHAARQKAKGYDWKEVALGYLRLCGV